MYNITHFQFFQILIFTTPQSILLILSSIVIVEGNILYKENLNITSIVKLFIFSILISLFMILPFITPIKNYTITVLISTIILNIVLFYFYYINIQASLLSSILSMHILVTSEILCSNFFNMVIDITDINFYFSHKFIYILPVTLLQFLSLLTLLKYNLKLNTLIKSKWSYLSVQKKTTYIVMTLLILFSFIFNLNYYSIYIRTLCGINMSKIKVNLFIFFVESIVISLITLLTINRTIMYENYKDIFKSDKNTYKTILYNSTDNDIYYYLNLIRAKNSNVELHDLVKFIEKYQALIKIKLVIDESISKLNINYINIYILTRELFDIIKRFSSINTQILLKTDENYITVRFLLLMNDLDKYKVLKYFNSNKCITNLIISIKELGYIYHIDIVNNLEINLLIPLKEVSLNV